MKPPSKRNNTGYQSKAAKAGFSPQQLLLEGGEPGGLSPAPHTKARALEGWGLKEGRRAGVGPWAGPPG